MSVSVVAVMAIANCDFAAIVRGDGTADHFKTARTYYLTNSVVDSLGMAPFRLLLLLPWLTVVLGNTIDLGAGHANSNATGGAGNDSIISEQFWLPPV